MEPIQRRSRVPLTTAGSHEHAFGWYEWGLLATVAGSFGSSFLFIAVGLEALPPAVVTAARLLLGTVTVAVVPGARGRIDRGDLPAVALLGLVWMAVPLTLIPIALQWVGSAVGGMVNGAVPVFAGLLAAVLLRRPLGAAATAGIALGFLGIVLMTWWPAEGGPQTTLLGVVLLVAAFFCVALGANLAIPLQQRYGALRVVSRAQLWGLALVTPWAIAEFGRVEWQPASWLAMLPLGILSSGLAFVALTTLVGRAGADRGAVAIYFVPVVAIALGVTLRGEVLHPAQVVGTLLILSGAWLTSRERKVARRSWLGHSG